VDRWEEEVSSVGEDIMQHCKLGVSVDWSGGEAGLYDLCSSPGNATPYSRCKKLKRGCFCGLMFLLDCLSQTDCIHAYT